MAFTKREIIKSLCKKGFRKERSGKHVFYRFFKNGIKTGIIVMFSHGSNKDIGRELESSLTRQCQISRKSFRGLVSCEVSSSDFIRLIETKGY